MSNKNFPKSTFCYCWGPQYATSQMQSQQMQSVTGFHQGPNLVAETHCCPNHLGSDHHCQKRSLQILLPALLLLLLLHHSEWPQIWLLHISPLQNNGLMRQSIFVILVDKERSKSILIITLWQGAASLVMKTHIWFSRHKYCAHLGRNQAMAWLYKPEPQTDKCRRWTNVAYNGIV